MKIAVIDLEGICTRTGKDFYGGKLTTCYIKKGSVLTIDTSTGASGTYTFTIELPLWETMGKKVKKQWEYTHEIHKLKWDYPGENYDDLLYVLKEVLKGYRVFAKGIILENRFLNKLGMYGESVVYRDVKHEWDIKVEDLNCYGCPKYPEEYHDPEREVSFFLGFILDNLYKF